MVSGEGAHRHIKVLSVPTQKTVAHHHTKKRDSLRLNIKTPYPYGIENSTLSIFGWKFFLSVLFSMRFVFFSVDLSVRRIRLMSLKYYGERI